MNTGDAVGPGMPVRERVKWAKGMILDWIDEAVGDFNIDPLASQDWDEQEELRKQRNRVAKLFGFPERDR
jgi:hypothetical protein